MAKKRESISVIEFIPYHGARFPDGHSKQGEEMPKGDQYFAVPGGGVASQTDIRMWGLERDVKVVFGMGG